MEFKCIFHDEPVGECPPVQELERLRKEIRELKERIRELETPRANVEIHPYIEQPGPYGTGGIIYTDRTEEQHG